MGVQLPGVVDEAKLRTMVQHTRPSLQSCTYAHTYTSETCAWQLDSWLKQPPCCDSDHGDADQDADEALPAGTTATAGVSMYAAMMPPFGAAAAASPTGKSLPREVLRCKGVFRLQGHPGVSTLQAVRDSYQIVTRVATGGGGGGGGDGAGGAAGTCTDSASAVPKDFKNRLVLIGRGLDWAAAEAELGKCIVKG